MCTLLTLLTDSTPHMWQPSPAWSCRALEKPSLAHCSMPWGSVKAHPLRRYAARTCRKSRAAGAQLQETQRRVWSGRFRLPVHCLREHVTMQGQGAQATGEVTIVSKGWTPLHTFREAAAGASGTGYRPACSSG